ncbi:MAG: uroporphyrinogen decarboxylase family protein [Planctomycetota bacterium]
MTMTSREVVTRTIRFQGADRIPWDLPEKFGTDIFWAGMDPSPDKRYSRGVDEWGAVWDNVGCSNLGEVRDFPLKRWADFGKLAIPDVRDPKRWENLKGARERAGDRFMLTMGISLYERIHFVRGLENTWMDIYDAPEDLGRLMDILVDMNCYAIEKCAAAGMDGLVLCDDWGLQDRLMIRAEAWRKLWKPRYARVYRAAHDAGLLTFLHSCGCITEILDDLIEIGLDVIQMDQQENMGLDFLGEKFGGRITFWNPVDIQATMIRGTLDDIRAYARRMVTTLGRPEGGFIARWYSDSVGAGHRPEAVEAMSDEFVTLGRQHPNLPYLHKRGKTARS